ncbi:hypothetical protein R3P38DRAFT_2390482, partial [Favolaschia claudopus]
SDAARALVHSLHRAERVQDMSAQLFDLCDPDIVRDIWKKSGVKIEIFHDVSKLKHCSTAYLLNPRVKSERMIVVYSAATAMHVVRLQWENWRDLIEQVHALGAPFDIVVKIPGFVSSSYQPGLHRCNSLGVRPEDYKPDKHDLERYLNILERFLLSPRGRLALQAGGVVARLARLIIPDSHLELTAEDVDVDTAEGHFRQGNTSVLFHRLTHAEEDLILGVYSIKMNQLNPMDPSGHQEKRVSWWPQAGAFFRSGLNVGWWTSDCERWFQEIMGEFRDGKAVVLNNSRWTRRLRGFNTS